jgi:NitT/TauT family transport system substrate-binding protein
MLKQGFNVDPLIQSKAHYISTMSYNEFWRVIDAGYRPSQLVVLMRRREHAFERGFARL